MLLALASLAAFAEDPPPPGAEPAPVEPAPAAPPTPAPVDPTVTHDQLRALRDTLLESVRSRNTEAVLGTLHPNVVFTTTNGEAVRGRDGVAAYVKRMLEGPDAIVERFAYDVSSDELSILYGDDTAIAWGPSVDHYTLTSGETFDLKSRWSATLVKVDGRWLVASVHSSVNLFDNPVLAAATGMLPKVGVGAGIAGMLLGALGGFLAGRRTR